MKKILGLILIFLIVFMFCMILLPLKIEAQEIHGNFESGVEADTGKGYSVINISFDFPVWVIDNSIYGGYETWFYWGELFQSYSRPYADLYKFGYKITYKNIYLNLQHICSHPVASADYTVIWKDNLAMYGDSTVVSIGVKW